MHDLPVADFYMLLYHCDYVLARKANMQAFAFHSPEIISEILDEYVVLTETEQEELYTQNRLKVAQIIGACKSKGG